MYGWFVDVAGPTLGAILFWLIAALLLIALFLGVYSLFRRAASASFLASGRNRKPRLAVVDVAAVDSRRRLVLVRRDDSEHLVLIGGPSDIVVETGIRRKTEERRSASDFAEPVVERSRPAPAVAAPAAVPASAEASASAVSPPIAVPEPEFIPEPVVAADSPVLPEPAPEPERKHSLLDLEISPTTRDEPAMPGRHEPPFRQDALSHTRLEPELPSRHEPMRAAMPAAAAAPPLRSEAGRVEPRLDIPAQPEQAEPALDFDAALLRELESDGIDLPSGPEATSPQKDASQPKPEETLSSIFADIVRRHRS